MTRMTASRPSTEVEAPGHLAEWVAAGLLSEAQATAIRQHEVEAGRLHPTDGRSGPSLVVEALGYLGALVMVVGAAILVGAYWPDLPVAGRLALLGAAAGLLLATGFAVLRRTEDAAVRLRAVLWAAGVTATAGFMVVLSDQVLDLHRADQLWLVGAVTAVAAGGLWLVRRTSVQLIAFFVPVLLTSVGVTLRFTDDETWAAGVAWAVGVLWAATSWASWIGPRVTGVACGALGAVLGALSMDRDLGIALGVGTAAATVALSLVERDRVWLAVGALTVLYTIPRAAEAWFPGQRSAALTFILVGAVLVGSAVWMARTGPGPGAHGQAS